MPQGIQPNWWPAATTNPVAPRLFRCSVDRDIRAFAGGRSDGEALLHALFDHVLDEPVPERLTALLRP